jgi:hypothetical protein
MSEKISGIESAAPMNPRTQMIVMATGRSLAGASFIIGWDYFYSFGLSTSNAKRISRRESRASVANIKSVVMQKLSDRREANNVIRIAGTVYSGALLAAHASSPASLARRLKAVRSGLT